MSAAIASAIVAAAPGNQLSIPCSGFTSGLATVTLSAQGAAKTGIIALPGTISGTSPNQLLAFAVPDGLSTDNALVADSGGPPATATFGLRVDSQYLQALEYVGEGVDVTSLPAGELDTILRTASSYADAFIGGSRRQLQYLERHKWRRSRRIFPYHKPIVTIDQLVFVSAPQIRTTFNVATDCYINADLNYVDILAYALGQYALLGSLEVIGFSANVIELTVTAGWPMLQYPQRLRDGTKMIATELLAYRKLNSVGMGPFEKVEDQLTRRRSTKEEPAFAISARARDLLRPYIERSIR